MKALETTFPIRRRPPAPPNPQTLAHSLNLNDVAQPSQQEDGCDRFQLESKASPTCKRCAPAPSNVKTMANRPNLKAVKAGAYFHDSTALANLKTLANPFQLEVKRCQTLST